MAERDVIIRIRAIDQASAVFSRVALAAGAFVSYWALQRGVRLATDAFIEAEATSITLAAALRATGNAAGFSAEELEDYSEELMRLTTVDDDAFKRIMGIMVTFRNVHGEVFKESIELIADMSVQFGGLESGAIRLGKALNDPVLGMSALSRVGIQFSEAQKQTIKRLVKENDLMGAQKIILAELTNQFGGQARAQVNSFGGAIDQLKNSLEKSAEAAGKFIAELPGLVTGIQVATVIVENLGLAWDVVSLSVQLMLAGIEADFEHTFTVALPEIGQFFKDNWIDTLLTADSLSGAFFGNLAKNIDLAIDDMKTVVDGSTFGRGGDAWTPMLDGFENTIGKFPGIAKRGMSDVEKVIAAELLKVQILLGTAIGDRLAAIPGFRQPGEPLALDEVEKEKKKGKTQADLIADESRFLTFGRVAGDAAIEAAREAKRAARIAQEQREKQSRQLERIARRAEMEIVGKGGSLFLDTWVDFFSNMAGKGGGPGMISPVTVDVTPGAVPRITEDRMEAALREARLSAQLTAPAGVKATVPVRLGGVDAVTGAARKAESQRDRHTKLLEKIAGEKRGPETGTIEIAVSNFR